MTPRQRPHPSTIHQLSFLDDAPEARIVHAEETPVTPFTPLSVARMWFRQFLEDADRPANTVESYTYDLVVLEHRLTDKPIHRITETDIALYLADSASKVTRKRRLTSAKAFFRYLTEDLKVLKADPTDTFAPHPLELHPPRILIHDEAQALMEAALADEPWSAPAIWLMLHLGVGRTELLALRRDHVDRTAIPGPEVLIAYDTPGKRAKQRTLVANEDFAAIIATYLDEKQPRDILFPFGPQAVNGMVERVAAAARIERKITPQLLRQTAAVAYARQDTSVNGMLTFLGLANDARNRETVRMYLDMARERSVPNEEEQP